MFPTITLSKLSDAVKFGTQVPMFPTITLSKLPGRTSRCVRLIC
jgi:hypothetical protein